MKKLLVVDGSNLLFQMFYGMPARIPGKNGAPIQGTLGFVGALLKVLRQTEPSHVVALFDGESENPRDALDPDYKSNRPDYSQMAEEDTPFSQLPDIYRALDRLGICHRETEHCEADDWMASYALCSGADEVVLLSQDSDLFQLISPRVKVLRYRGENSVLWDEAHLQAKLNIRPEQYAAYKSLTGDHSDNLRGVDKVGPKTAAALMAQFGTLDGLLAGAETIQKPSIRKAVTEQRDRIQKNYALIRLTGWEELPFSPDELAFRDRGLTTTQVLQEIGVR